jgi:uncharacterized membrane protein YraQ (UPF0718 family)
VEIVGAVGRALAISFAMTWEILWALILGFGLSAIVQAVVPKERISRLLPDDSARSLAVASLLGAASSSCSYAAVALARSLVQKGADFTAAMAFEIASTNLVIELGIILVILMGWQFAAAEFVGGPIMIVVLALVLRRVASRRLVADAHAQAERGLRGYMEGHAAMDMSVSGGTIAARIFSPRGFTAISHLFVMDWLSVLRDVVGGLLIAGALAAWVPDAFWRGFFLSDQPQLAALWGPLVGPLISVISFVCSIGNVPLAAVLWNGGISFGGVVSFIFADLIILPILSIKRRYYGARMTLVLFGSFYFAMAFAGYVVELLFGAVGLVPAERRAIVSEATITLNYTSVLDVLFLALAAILVIRAWRTGVGEMVAVMA